MPSEKYVWSVLGSGIFVLFVIVNLLNGVNINEIIYYLGVAAFGLAILFIIGLIYYIIIISPKEHSERDQLRRYHLELLRKKRAENPNVRSQGYMSLYNYEINVYGTAEEINEFRENHPGIDRIRGIRVHYQGY